ncbi:MAG: DUF3667 domain-containing protein, partial [Bacteroidota bacterium]
MSTEQKNCQNCGYQLTPYHNFCPNCGQKVDDKLSMRVLFHNTIMNYFSVDARFFRSFIPLLVRPGFLAKKFVLGKRLLYLHPAQFYLFASIVFFFIFSISTRATQQDMENSIRRSFGKEREFVREAQNVVDSVRKQIKKEDSIQNKIPPIVEALQKDSQVIIDETLSDTVAKTQKQTKSRKQAAQEQMLGFYFDTATLDSLYQANAPMEEKLKAIGVDEKQNNWFEMFIAKQVIKFREKRGDGIVKAFMDTIPISMFFLIPIFAFLLKILYRKRGRFAHHMVFSFYFFAFIFLAASIIIIGNYIIDIAAWINVVLVLSMLIYLFIS